MMKLISTLRELFKPKVKGFNSHVKFNEIYPEGYDKAFDMVLDDMYDDVIFTNNRRGKFWDLGVPLEKPRKWN